MTTKSLTDYAGAVADGQYSRGAFTLTAGQKHLACPTSPVRIWQNGDVGSFIVVGNAGGPGPQGGSPLCEISTGVFLTIAAVDSDGKGVTLSHNAVKTLPFNDADGIRTIFIVSWGATNNATALTAWQTEFAGQTGVVLTLPGTFLISSGNFGPIGSGIKQFTINGPGSFCGGSYQLGAPSQQGTSGHSARFQSASAGAVSVTLVNPSDASKVSVGQWILPSGEATQFGGFPSNHAVYEYSLVSAIAGSLVSLSAPLINAYLSTWPLYDATGLDYGGPATLYAFDPKFDCTAIFNDITFVHDAQFSSSGLDITLNRCTSISDFGLFPTGAKTTRYTDTNGPLCTMEVDKYLFDFTMTRCNWGGIAFQSNSPKNVTLDASSIQFSISGTPENIVIKAGSNVGTLAPGAVYGFNKKLIAYGSPSRPITIANFGAVGTHESGHAIGGGDFNNNGVQIDFTMTNGVIFIPAAFYGFGIITQFAVKGEYLFLEDPNIGTIGGFNILDVTQDGSGVYLITDWTGTWPSRSFFQGKLRMRAHPAQSVTFRNVVGCREVLDLCGAAAGRPLYEYSNRSHTGANASDEYFQVWGNVEYLIIRVPTAYTGATGSVTATAQNNFVRVSDRSDYTLAPTVNLKITGTRTLDLRDGVYPKAWTGVQSGDSLASVTEPIWSAFNFRRTMTDISGENPATWPAYSIEFSANQRVSKPHSVLCAFG